MPDSNEALRLIVELIAAGGVIGTGIMALLRLGAIGERIEHHGEKLEKMDAQLDRQDQTLSTLAVQKRDLENLREAMAQHRKETSETFSRIFDRFDGRGKGMTRD